MFSQLSEKIKATVHKISGRGKLSESDVTSFAKELRFNLLSADVHYQTARQFADEVAQKALGQKIVGSFRPAEIFHNAVYQELITILGKEPATLPMPSQANVLFVAGLTGSGKTTSLAKLGRWSASQGHRVLLVSTDVRRPAAMEQLKVLGEELSLSVFPAEAKHKPKKILKLAISEMKKGGYSLLLVDTAGRLHVEDELMKELQDLIKRVDSPQVLYVMDAAAGQDALKSVALFKEKIPLNGLILSKVDSDARGGAALSVRSVTELAIYFIGTGEKPEDFELFNPERFAGRIMGMGDMASLAEKIQASVDEDFIEKSQKKLMKGGFDLEDLRDQFRQASKLGGMQQIMGMMPGKFGEMAGNVDSEKMEKELKHKEAIINSMTPAERKNPKILNGSRRKRIAHGSGMPVSQVNRLLKEFEMMRKMFKGGGMMGKMSKMLKRLDGSVGR